MFREFFLFYHEIVTGVYSLESPHRGNSNEYTQHIIIVTEIKKSINYHYFVSDLAPWLTLSGSNYPCLEQIFMVRKGFEPSKFDCINEKKTSIFVHSYIVFSKENLYRIYIVTSFKENHFADDNVLGKRIAIHFVYMLWIW